MKKLTAVSITVGLIVLLFSVSAFAAQGRQKDGMPVPGGKPLPPAAKVIASDLKNRTEIPQTGILRKAEVKTQPSSLTEEERRNHLLGLYGKNPKVHRSVNKKDIERLAKELKPPVVARVEEKKSNKLAMVIGSVITVILVMLLYWRLKAGSEEKPKPVRVSIPGAGRTPDVVAVIDDDIQKEWVQDYMSQTGTDRERESARLRRIRGVQAEKETEKKVEEGWLKGYMAQTAPETGPTTEPAEEQPVEVAGEIEEEVLDAEVEEDVEVGEPVEAEAGWVDEYISEAGGGSTPAEVVEEEAAEVVEVAEEGESDVDWVEDVFKETGKDGKPTENE
ncbi:MAG: hypothetical protein ACYS8W_20175 [Planctomycetota bacterium]